MYRITTHRHGRLLNVGNAAVATEEALLGIVALRLNTRAIAYQRIYEVSPLFIVNRGKELTSREVYNRVESSRHSNILKTFAVYGCVVGALAEVEDIFVWTILLTLGNNRIYRRLAYTLDCCQTETNISLLICRETHLRLVNIGRKYADTHTLALFHIQLQLLNIAEVGTEQCRHILGRIVGFEVGSLVCHPRIAGCVRLVEGVRCKLNPILPNLFENFFVVSVCCSTLQELRLQLHQFCQNLLTHSLTQGVCLASCEVGKESRKQHHLLLIYRNSVSIFEILLHNRNIIDDRCATVLTVDKVRNIVHRSRTIESIHRNQILENRRLQLAKILLHTIGLELECSERMTCTIEVVGLFIVNRNSIDINIYPLCTADILHRILHNREVFQTEEVHLDKTCILDYRAFVLCYENLLACLLVVSR